jgi:hypothetical protein
MSAATVAFVGALCDRHRFLLPVLQEHLDDFDGEVLPHLLMADIERWAEGEVAEARAGIDSDVVAVLSSIEQAFAALGDTDVGELIAASFVEHLPRSGALGADFRARLGPLCLAQLNLIG